MNSGWALVAPAGDQGVREGRATAAVQNGGNGDSAPCALGEALMDEARD